MRTLALSLSLPRPWPWPQPGLSAHFCFFCSIARPRHLGVSTQVARKKPRRRIRGLRAIRAKREKRMTTETVSWGWWPCHSLVRSLTSAPASVGVGTVHLLQHVSWGETAQAGTGGKVRFPAGETGLSSLSLWVDICTWPLLLAVTGSNLVCQGSLLRSEERIGPQGSIHSAHAAEGLSALCSGKYESGSEMWV